MSFVSLGVEWCTSMVVVLGMVCGCGSAIVYSVGSVCKCMCVVPGIGAAGFGRVLGRVVLRCIAGGMPLGMGCARKLQYSQR